MRSVFLLQGTLQVFVAIGALVAGVMLVAQPDGSSLGMHTGLLQGRAFASFLIPGITLVLINGCGQLFAAYLTLRYDRNAGIAGGVFGLGLIIWIYVQIIVIGGGHWLQHTYFGFGLLQTVLAFFIDREIRSRHQHQ